MTADYDLVPERVLIALRRWISSGIWPGSFLTGLLIGNLRQVYNRADKTNAKALYHIIGWLCEQAPATCWGDRLTAENWHEKTRRAREVFLEEQKIDMLRKAKVGPGKLLTFEKTEAEVKAK